MYFFLVLAQPDLADGITEVGDFAFLSAAAKFQNPVLLSISFKSYRHWGGSMLAHITNGNVLVIKKMLRHKSIANTMKYIHTIEFKEEDYEETTATTPEEIRQLESRLGKIR